MLLLGMFVKKYIGLRIKKGRDKYIHEKKSDIWKLKVEEIDPYLCMTNVYVCVKSASVNRG